MNDSFLTASKVFWFFISFLCAIGGMVLYLAIKVTMEKGGTLSDTPAYMYFFLGVIVLDIGRRISFYLQNKDDQLLIKDNLLVLIRDGVERKFSPDQLKKVKKRPGSGFIYLETYGGINYKIQPWLFGKTMGQIVAMLKDNGFKEVVK